MPAGQLRIPYETEDFPPGSVANGTADLPVTWNEILWAAVTVGRPNRQYVFRHGDASLYEAVFRWSLVRMALEQSSPAAHRLRRTSAARTLDPTEKGAVNYFLGMSFCKLIAARLLNTPWLLHLDVFRPALDPVLAGRSRPDLVGQEVGTGRWHAFECKGRVSPPTREARQKAKDQALRLVSVNGTACSLHVGAVTYLRGDVLHFYWRDPVPSEGNRIEVSLGHDAWRRYYEPLVEVVGGDVHSSDRDRMLSRTGEFLRIDGPDLAVSIHPAVGKFLFHEQWAVARAAAEEAHREIAESGYQPDGLAVQAGHSWRDRFEPTSLSE